MTEIFDPVPTENNPNGIRLGDVVRLNLLEGYPMVVDAIIMNVNHNRYMAECVWHVKGVPYRERYVLDILTKA